MKALDIHEHLKAKGTWVNWKASVDRFLFGDPGIEVKGVAVAWMPTFPNLKKADELGCNLFITHEPLYAAVANEYGVYAVNGILLEEDDVWVRKGEWLEEKDITVLRCHDVWDDFPEIGIHGAWARWLGFNGKPAKQVKFYEVHEMEPKPFKDFAMHVLKRVKGLGQDVALVIGDPEREVSRVALGTGAITNYRQMAQMDPDVIILTDDGTRLWESAQWAEDTGFPVIIVNHATAEEPGVRKLAEYLDGQFPDVHVRAIERGCLYKAIY